MGTITPPSCSSAGKGAMPSLAPNGKQYSFTLVNLEEGRGGAGTRSCRFNLATPNVQVSWVAATSSVGRMTSHKSNGDFVPLGMLGTRTDDGRGIPSLE